MITRAILIIGMLISSGNSAADSSLLGLLDMRATSSDSSQSFFEGGNGKFQTSDGFHAKIAQLGLDYTGETGPLGIHLVATASSGESSNVGLTEAYLYLNKQLASDWRIGSRFGVFYPEISVENSLRAWASPYSLNYSSISSWAAEELRYRALEINLKHDNDIRDSALELRLALFEGNDPAAALLAWHGWTSHSRQSVYGEGILTPNSELPFVPEESEPFLELDDRQGVHANLHWQANSRASVLIGHYDNNANPNVVENLQYAWATEFAHLGFEFDASSSVTLHGQALSGSTQMRSVFTGEVIVEAEFSSAFLSVSKQWQQHRLSLRAEQFQITDLDDTLVDNNEEDGWGINLAYLWRASPSLYWHAEYTHWHSDRPVREQRGSESELTESQFQVALRWFFN